MTSANNIKRIEFAPHFQQKLEQVPFEIKIAFREALEIFLEDQYHPSLCNHTLQDEYAGINSLDITDDYRALYRVVSGRIIFVILGTHKSLYG